MTPNMKLVSFTLALALIEVLLPVFGSKMQSPNPILMRELLVFSTVSCLIVAASVGLYQAIYRRFTAIPLVFFYSVLMFLIAYNITVEKLIADSV